MSSWFGKENRNLTDAKASVNGQTSQLKVLDLTDWRIHLGNFAMSLAFINTGPVCSYENSSGTQSSSHIRRAEAWGKRGFVAKF